MRSLGPQGSLWSRSDGSSVGCASTAADSAERSKYQPGILRWSEIPVTSSAADVDSGHSPTPAHGDQRVVYTPALSPIGVVLGSLWLGRGARSDRPPQYSCD